MSAGKLSHFNVSLFKEEAVYIHIPTADYKPRFTNL